LSVRETKSTAGAVIPTAAWLAATVALLLMVTACSLTTPNAGAAYGSDSTAMAVGLGSSGASSSPGGPTAPAGTVLTIQKTKIGYVLADAAGHSVY